MSLFEFVVGEWIRWYVTIPTDVIEFSQIFFQADQPIILQYWNRIKLLLYIVFKITTSIELLWFHFCCVYVAVLFSMHVAVWYYCFLFYYEGSSQTTMKILIALISLMSIVMPQSKYLLTYGVHYDFQNIHNI